MDLLGGLPFPLLSVRVDGGSEFMAGFEDACEELCTPLHVLPPRRPQWNGCLRAADVIAAGVSCAQSTPGTFLSKHRVGNGVTTELFVRVGRGEYKLNRG